jgi:hypothetical protein
MLNGGAENKKRCSHGEVVDVSRKGMRELVAKYGYGYVPPMRQVTHHCD